MQVSPEPLYTITAREESTGKVIRDSTGSAVLFGLLLNPDHPVYRGHFPGNPVLPGVCQLQVIRELAEEVLHVPLVMTGAGQVKFLSMVSPRITTRLTVNLEIRETEGHAWSVNATIGEAPDLFLKFRGTFVKHDLSGGN